MTIADHPPRLRVLVAGIGKMGLSHLSMLRAHPQVDVVGVCDSTTYVLDVLGKYTGLPTFTDYDAMIGSVPADAVLIATPTRKHFDMATSALSAGLHVFCEKPLCLSPQQSEALVAQAASRGLVGQVGYHNRFVGSFREVKSLLDAGAIGPVTHALVEAYGPVVLKAQGGTWRSRRAEGGGALYDYAAHPLDLVNWYLGNPVSASGATLGRVYSAETEDEVYGSIDFEGGATAQLSVNWSDESYRKMTTRVTIWGRDGRITADRQECQVYLRANASPPDGYRHGWNVRYTTELTEPVWFYVRGEEYSAQIDSFVRSASAAMTGAPLAVVNDFASALATDRVIEMLVRDNASRRGPRPRQEPPLHAPSRTGRLRRWWASRGRAKSR